MPFFQTEARISKDPLVGLIKKSNEDSNENKLLAIIGAAKDDNGKLIVPQAVLDAAHEIDKDGLDLNYIPSSGIKELANLLTEEIVGKKTLLELFKNKIYNSAVMCSGGTNAISLSLMATTSAKDSIITHSPHWPGFNSILLGINRKPFVTFQLLNDDGEFNIEGFKERIEETLVNPSGNGSNPGLSNKLNIVINTPYDNPMGIDFGVKAWEEIGKLLGSYSANNPDLEITMVLDTAYIDFGPGGKDYTRLNFLPKLFKTVNNPNFNIVIAGSVSKSFAMYGARVGIAILLSENESNVTNWVDIVGGLVRGTYSNSSRHGEEIALRVLQDMNKLANIHTFQADTVDLISDRTKHFLDYMLSKNNSNDKDSRIIKLETGIEMIQPNGGFFISLKLPSEEFALNLYQKFLEEHTYIPLIENKYLRIPSCGLKKEVLEKLADKITDLSKQAQ